MFKKALIALSLFLGLSANALALDQPFDHSVFDQFLKQYVNEAGDVDYSAAKKSPELLNRYLEILKKIDPKDFANWPREEMIAVGINAYHASLIKKILDHYPISSVQKIPGFWQMDTVTIGKKHYGLNGIRHNFLMVNYREVKVHMALSYAAKSGPKLSRDAYTGTAIEAQLFLAAKRFVNDPERNTVQPGKRKIYLSKIFEWHNSDFTLDFGAFENEKDLSQLEYAILSFVANYLEDPEKIRYLEDGKYKIKYHSFDWTLNDSSAPAASSGRS